MPEQQPQYRHILLLIVLGLMIFFIVALNVTAWRNGVNLSDLPDRQAFDLDAVLADILPDENAIETLFQPPLSEGALAVDERAVIARDGDTIPIYVSKPEGLGPFPVLIIVHDRPASARSTQLIAEEVGAVISERSNALTITVDYRDSAFAEEEFTDVISVVSWASDLQEASDQPIDILGIGHGAYLATLVHERASSSLDESIALGTVISISGYTTPGDVLTQLEESRPDAVSGFLVSTGCAEQIDSASCVESLRIDPAVLADVPVLAVHSSLDDIVSIDQSRALIDANAQEDSALVEVTDESASHHELLNARSSSYDAAIDAIVDWYGAASGAVAQESGDSLEDEVITALEPIIIEAQETE